MGFYMLEKMEKIMEENKLDQATEDAIEEAVESNDNIKQLRDEFKKLKAENKAFKAQAMNSALESLGLEADKGIGKAVTKLYDGEMNVSDIKDFVSNEFGDAINAEPVVENNVAENVTQAQGRVEQLNKLGVNAEPVDISQEFNNFINDSNTSTRDSINAKLRMLDTLKEQDKK
jgi:hypothetical protein|tara:strand:+ start:1761 stop:2282 length:522 start_codon:yes stop_codon:yes gene_type:complete